MKALIYAVVVLFSTILCSRANATTQVTLSQTVLLPYALQQGSATGAITAQAKFSDTLSVVPIKGFVGAVALSCAASSGTCGVSPTTLTFDGSGTPMKVNVTYGAPTIAASSALFMLSLLGLKRGRNGARRARVVAIVGLGLALGVSGCGWGVLPNPFDGAPTQTMQVTATYRSYAPNVAYNITIAQ